MTCNNKGNNRSKVTSQLATYPFSHFQKGFHPDSATRTITIRSKHERDICGRQIIFRSSAVLWQRYPSLPLESINKRYWPPFGRRENIRSSHQRQ